MKRLKSFLLVAGGIGAVALALVLTLPSPGYRRNPSKLAPRPNPSNYGNLPLSFEPNRGQTDPEVKFLSRGKGYTLFLTPSEAALSLASGAGQGDARRSANRAQPARTTVLRVQLMDANSSAQIEGLNELPGKSNYFIGNDPAKWRTNVPTYARVKYRGVYPGVDLVYYGNQRELEYDFVVAPGADPQRIRLKIQGAREMKIGEQGDLVLAARDGEVRFRKPVVYQDADGARQEIAGGYVLRSKDTIGIELANYDANLPLVIDPVIVYSTFLGGSNNDGGNAIATDATGNAYVTGFTVSNTFPTTPGAFQATFPPGANPGGSNEVVVTKLNPTGTALVYSTYLGGKTNSLSFGIALDAAGNAYVTGWTDTTDFPTTIGAFQTAIINGERTAFVTKLNAMGSALVYSTLLGGGNVESRAFAIAVDGSGNAFVTGRIFPTGSLAADFPTTPGAFQTTPGGNNDGFVTKLNSTGTALMYSTYLGGSNADQGNGIVVDAAGNAYVTGSAASPNFPTTPGVFQPAFLGTPPGSDGFVAKLNPTGTALVYSTFLGQALDTAIALDAAGNAYITGASGSGYPTTPGAFQTTAGINGAAIVTKLNPAGTALVYSTFLGGAGGQFGQIAGEGIAVDAAGDATVAGFTQNATFPCVGQPSPPPLIVWVAKVNPTGTALLGSATLNGGTSSPNFTKTHGLAVDPAGLAYVVGETSSSDFQTTPGAFQTSLASGVSAALFVAKFDLSLAPGQGPCGTSATALPAQLQFGSLTIGSTSPAQTVTLTNTGTLPLTVTGVAIGGTNPGDFVDPDNCVSSSPLAPNATCTANITFKPTAAGTRSATLTFTDGAGTQNVALQGTGVAAAPGAVLSPTSLNFAAQAVGSTSAGQTTTLTNNGNATLTITGITLSGNNAGDFAQTNTCGASLNAGANCAATVTFKPTATGNRAAALMVSDNASGSPQSAGLTGTGVDFSMAASPSTATVKAGATANFTISVTPGTGGFPNAVALSASGLPTLAMGTFTPGSVTPGNSAAMSTFSISTTSTSLSLAPPAGAPGSGSARGPLLLALWLAAVGLLGVGGFRRRSRPRLAQSFAAAALLTLLLGLAGFASGCHGGFPGEKPGTPAGNFTITVTGASGSLQHSTSVTLTVQ